MSSDMMYPNQGDQLASADLSPWNPEQPKERTEQERQELLDIASSAKVIQDVMAWLDKNIEFYGNLDSIDVIGGTDQSLQVSLHIAKGMQEQFRTRKSEFTRLYTEILKQKELIETQ